MPDSSKVWVTPCVSTCRSFCLTTSAVSMLKRSRSVLPTISSALLPAKAAPAELIIKYRPCRSFTNTASVVPSVMPRNSETLCCSSLERISSCLCTTNIRPPAATNETRTSATDQANCSWARLSKSGNTMAGISRGLYSASICNQFERGSAVGGSSCSSHRAGSAISTT